MAKPWKEVIASPEYQALPDIEKAKAQDEYFQSVVAPNAGAGVAKARAEFFKAYPVAVTPPKESAYNLQQRAMRGDADALAEYNRRAASVGQKTLEQDREANAPTSGDNGSFLTGGGNFWSGVGSSFVNTGMGLKQIGMDAANKVGLVDDRASAQYQGQIDRERALQAPLMDTGAGIAGNAVGTFAQFYAGGAALAPFKAAQGAGMMARMGAGAGNGAFGGAVVSATQPVATGRTRLDNMDEGTIYGGIGGGVGVPAGALISKVARGGADKIGAMQKELYDKAKALGIDVMPHQLSDSRVVKWLSSVVKDIPFTGANATNRRQIDQFTKAASNLVGKNTKELSPKVMNEVEGQIDTLYNSAFDDVNVSLDNQFNTQLNALRTRLGADLNSSSREQFDNLVREIGQDISDGQMTGKIYQNIRKTRLNKLINSKSDTDYAQAVRDLRDLLDDAARRSLPPERMAMFDRAQELYRNNKVVSKALTFKDGMDVKTRTQGQVNPATFETAIGSKYRPTQEVEDLGRIGQMIKDPAPQSGSTPRALASLLALGGAGAVTPVGIFGGLATGIGVGRVANSPLLSRYLAEGVGDIAIPKLGKSIPVQRIANYVGEKAPGAIAAGAAGVAIPAYASPQEFDAQMEQQVKSGALTMPEAAAQLDAYLQMMAQKEGIEKVRETYKQFPHWDRVLSY
jgi:hypothetical protein